MQQTGEGGGGCCHGDVPACMGLAGGRWWCHTSPSCSWALNWGWGRESGVISDEDRRESVAVIRPSEGQNRWTVSHEQSGPDVGSSQRQIRVWLWALRVLRWSKMRRPGPRLSGGETRFCATLTCRVQVKLRPEPDPVLIAISDSGTYLLTTVLHLEVGILLGSSQKMTSSTFSTRQKWTLWQTLACLKQFC